MTEALLARGESACTHRATINNVQMPHGVLVQHAPMRARLVAFIPNVHKIDALLLAEVKEAEDGFVGEADLQWASSDAHVSMTSSASGTAARTTDHALAIVQNLNGRL